MSVHYIDLGKPWDTRIEVALREDGYVLALRPMLFEPAETLVELGMQRSVIFALATLQGAHKTGRLVEDLQRHFKHLPGFECEYAVIKAIAELLAELYRVQTVELFKHKGAA